ncbi:MAG TPA: response regulator transcription factor [Casimicrobiaceae bacterium]|nr:response regulator transcription factor [Casimicrobiaceae bacterium]
MGNTQTRVFIVEDSPEVRQSLADLLHGIDGVSVVGEAGTPDDAVAGIRRTGPDCVVLDFQLIGGTGVEVLRAIHPASPEIVFVVLTNHPNAQYRRICMEAGARWFFDKSTEFRKLKDVITGFHSVQH